ncbi:MAG TPA: PIG-L family deacetylase [Minicystis sp.]|nr:PIG-L family deacetylase [Minicystis sp.]
MRRGALFDLAEAAGVARAGRVMFVVAHPDDETVAAGATLASVPEPLVVHVTDGAPRDPSLRPGAPNARRDEYAAARRAEVGRALALARIDEDRVACLGAIDQEAALELVPLVERLVAHVAAFAPALLVTHPYEGGHPDHDACAFIARAVVDRLAADGALAPLLVEAASYHAAGGELVTCRFVPGTGGEEYVFELDRAAAARKRAMFDCFVTQRDTLALMAIDAERFRVAPRYDFAAAPHAGPLYSERYGWPLDGARFRALARAALEELARTQG